MCWRSVPEFGYCGGAEKRSNWGPVGSASTIVEDGMRNQQLVGTPANHTEPSPEQKASEIINKVPSTSLWTKTGGIILGTGLTAAAISNELYVGVLIEAGTWTSSSSVTGHPDCMFVWQ